MRKSGEFKFVKEINIKNRILYTEDKFIELALSFGGIQTAIKKYNEDIKDNIELFKRVIYENFNNKPKEVKFIYHIRVGVAHCTQFI